MLMPRILARVSMKQQSDRRWSRQRSRETQSLFYGSGNDITLIESTDKIGIGLLYASVTDAIKSWFSPRGKTMGLAPYGGGLLDGGAMFEFNGQFHGIETDYSDFCEEGSYQIKRDLPPFDSFEAKAQGAFEVQAECERAMLHLAEHAFKVTGSKNLCISGGVGLNSVANHKIYEARLFDKVFINPAASDTGIPLGAALYGLHKIKGQEKTYGEISPYLGPTYSVDAINTAIEMFDGYEVIRDNAVQLACEILANNKILARFEGRSEIGPRALGHRSILMSPLQAENKDTLNAKVKFRESFRPFAPAVLEELSNEYFEIDCSCPYMLMIPKVRPEKLTVVPATTHVDGTARLQTVTKARNGAFYDLIHGFYEHTGVPVLLNTSFNIAGEPIVETPEDAIKCFSATAIDALLIEDTLLIKNSSLKFA